MPATTIKVRATATGYYESDPNAGPRVYHDGDEFDLVERKGLIGEKRPVIDQSTGKPLVDQQSGKVKTEPTGRNVPHVFTPEEQFSPAWMEKVADNPVHRPAVMNVEPIAASRRSRQPVARSRELVEDMAS